MHKDWTGASIDELFFYKSKINRLTLHDPNPVHKINHRIVSHLEVTALTGIETRIMIIEEFLG